MNCNLSQLEPLFCKHTGAYPALVAEFCINSLNDMPKSIYKIVKARKPELLDQNPWLEAYHGVLKPRLHRNAKLYHGARSILRRDVQSTSLVINSQAGFFAELDGLSENNIEALRTYQALSDFKDTSLAICLLRYKLFEINDIDDLHGPNNDCIYKLEHGSELIDANNRYIIRNKLSGVAFFIDYELTGLLMKYHHLHVYPQDAQYTVCANLCAHGILRRIAK
ncbi:hypothetical protein [Fastidiosibacter lacustris]|uniref:hypothetical protein n=1 Tax=Fastidiosibacter lacustris TaxID=2056695 RepID=UPI000E348549|nr:hypothetical protein [Fastidiosibacter lacustris]